MPASSISRRAALALAGLAAPAAAHAIPKGQKAKPGPGFIYVFVVEGAALAKVGWSREPQVRLERLVGQTGLPLSLALTMPRTPGLERRLQSRFPRQRIALEWLRIEGEFADWLTAETAQRAQAPAGSGGSMTRAPGGGLASNGA